MFLKQYRIVTDQSLGYEVQCRRWWFPFWVQCGDERGRPTNTHSTVVAAQMFISNHRAGVGCRAQEVWREGKNNVS